MSSSIAPIQPKPPSTSATTNESLSQLLEDPSFIGVTLSPPKLLVKKILLRKRAFFQISEQKGAQIFHRNLEPQAFREWFFEVLPRYKQALFKMKEQDFQLLISKKGLRTLNKIEVSHRKDFSHNREKKSHLSKDSLETLLKIGPDKKRQIEKFLEEISLHLSRFDKGKPLTIVDFGCGKAYLTFALYAYLQPQFNITITGIDRKKEVVLSNQKLAKELGFEKLYFKEGSIEDNPVEKIDIAIALHACDSATDHALAQAVHADAVLILAAPCCQHTHRKEINAEPLFLFLKHPILRERFSALMTDALRAAILEVHGYKADIVEFIDSEHTPKNLLIRAVKQKNPISSKKNLSRLEEFKKFISIDPLLERLLQ